MQHRFQFSGIKKGAKISFHRHLDILQHKVKVALAKITEDNRFCELSTSEALTLVTTVEQINSYFILLYFTSTMNKIFKIAITALEITLSNFLLCHNFTGHKQLCRRLN